MTGGCETFCQFFLPLKCQSLLLSPKHLENKGHKKFDAKIGRFVFVSVTSNSNKFVEKVKTIGK